MDNYEKAYTAYCEVLGIEALGINVKENEQIVLECKTFWSYFFARDIKGVDIKAHEEVILELKDPQYSFYFARDVPGANIEKHFKIIFNSKNKHWLDYFVKFVNYKNTKVEEWLLYI